MINQIMMQIPAQPSVTYPIKIGSNLLANPHQWLPADWRNKHWIIITDDTVGEIYGKSLLEALKDTDILWLSILPGEASKNYQIKHALEEKMIQHGCHRESIILALGGGVVGDIAGFIAATYLRGIHYIQLPTTLLAMVDSSIGGKTAINTLQGKNLIGAFWQPTAVVVDTHCLRTLSQTHLINGLIEALKMFMTHDSNSLHYAHHHLEFILNKEGGILQDIIERAIKIKIATVSADEKDRQERMTLNFGHTIGHALEKVTNYTLLHGYAVALGILVESKISQLLEYVSVEDYHVIASLLLKLNISGAQLKNINIEAIILATKCDKKNKDNTACYILLKKLGQVHHHGTMFSFPVADDMVKQALLAVSEAPDGRE